MAKKMARKFILTVIAALLLVQAQTSYGAEAAADPDDPAQTPAYEKVIAHGGGAYKGYETTNSVEAVNNAIENGYKIIELDMDLSSDGKIIMLHDWDRTAEHYFGAAFSRKLSQKQFSNLTVHGRLEVLTFEKLAGILERHKDIRIITDTKGSNLELLSAIKEQYPQLTDRLIPQIYDYDQWSKVRELGFSDVILTIYAMADPDMDKIAAFAKEHGIYAVTMPDYFAERGYCSRLSGKGVKVYIHPVSSYEDAQQFFRLGAYGVYSGSLLPEEFDGVEKDCYLALSNPGGAAEKLTDEWIGSLKELKLYGQKPGDSVFFTLDRSGSRADDTALSALTPGKHRLTVNVFKGKTAGVALDYYLWKEADRYRVVHKKYEYRLDAIKKDKDFNTAICEAGVPEEAAAILAGSLISKQGEAVYYDNGSPESYMNGEELLTVQEGSYGKLLLPLSDTLKRLGATSVIMDKSRDVAIVYGGEKYRIMADSSIIRKGFITERLSFPVVLYLNKAMAGGEFYRFFTGRESIEKDGIMIILPTGAKLDKGMKEQLFKAAGKLY
jgi:glycerophosphoryl diester phosphodiesterase